MKQIPLTQGQVALVDDEDYDWLMEMSWHFDRGYAWTSIPKNGGGYRRVSMHRLITDPPDGMFPDHINHNKLDNRRENLRICTHQENCQNRGIQSNNSSGYRGVSWSDYRQCWIAQIHIQRKTIKIGEYDSAIDAAKAYDAEAKTAFGEFAYLNFPENW